MFSDDGRITWLASFPKSGNTWVRCLLQAYRNNGQLDINDLYTGTGDSSACYYRSVSPVPLEELGDRGLWLIRPAALLHACLAMRPPLLFKTHYANLTLPGLPSFIPREFTERGLYIVRDPRSVVLSLSNFLDFSTKKTVEHMNNKEFTIGTDTRQVTNVVSSWTNNVRSWCSEQRFPVHVVRYEDLLENPLQEFKEILEFLNVEFDEEKAKRAIKATELSKLRKTEKDFGFNEYHGSKFQGQFFNKGGTRWKDELGSKWIKQIEDDHGKLMEELGYEIS